MASQPLLFISYRRTDGAGHAGRLCAALERALGKGLIFRDVQTISAGSNFLEAITQGIRAATHILVVIGPDWLVSMGGASPRLFAEDDVVRAEIRLSLQLDKKVIPVLVGGASMPRVDQLPKDLGALALCNALEVSEARWDFDTDRILAAVGSEARTTDRPSLPWSALAGLLVILSAAALDASSAYGLRSGARVFLGCLATGLGLVDPLLRRAGSVRWRGLGWVSCALGMGLATFGVLARTAAR